MSRYASIDIGTNSVLLLVAERDASGDFRPVLERAEITRLGRSVDRTHRLSEQAVEDTLEVVADYVRQAQAAGAKDWVVSATSAARDAENWQEFLGRAKERAGVEVQILSGDLEAILVYSAAVADFGRRFPGESFVVIDIGGGSTELVYGANGVPGEISFRRSYNVGSVRLTERYLTSDPISIQERERLTSELVRTFSELPCPPNSRVIGVAGTVTTLYAVQNRVEPYDAARVHGATLTLAELKSLTRKLCETPLAQRRELPGLQPKRADVICAGALILEVALEKLRASECLVSDRGLRWGLLLERFGKNPDASS